MSNEADGLLQGLATGLNSYLGTQIEAQNKMTEMKATTDYATQKEESKQKAMESRQLDLEKAKNADKLSTDTQLEQNKLKMQGQVTPDMAESLIPGASKWVNDFQSQNSRYPTVEEANTGLIKAHEKLNAGSDSEDKRQDKLEQQARMMLTSIRGDPSIKRVEDQRDASTTAYNLIKDIKNENRDPSQAEYYDLLGQLWKARTGAAPTDQAIKDLDAHTFKGNLSKAVTYFTGNPTAVGATTKDVLDNVQSFAAKTGLQADQLHGGYMAARTKKPTGLSQDRWDAISAEHGLSFAEATGYHKDQSIGDKKAALRAKLEAMRSGQ